MVQYGEYVDANCSLEPSAKIDFKPVVPQGEIVGSFSEVKSKNDVINAFFEFGGRCFANLAVFSVYSNSIQFLKGLGDNVQDRPYIGALKVDTNTVVRRAIINRYPYKGRIPIGKDEKTVFSKFFNSYAEEVFIYPCSISGDETDILFYADTFKEERRASLHTFEYVVEKTMLALRLLWVQKQLITI